MMPNHSEYIGMMERDPVSVYDLLPLTLDDIDSKSGSEGNCHLVRECNMLHHSEAGGEEDDTYPILRTPEQQSEYEKKHLE